ncbi:MAG: TolC family protein [Bacteroidales bacterium]|jgi:outer membrane protein TolC|nr:TolC family protein [Bacteroidales bacterium]
MRKTVLTIVASIFAGLAVQIAAQDFNKDAGTYNVSLQEAVDYAQANNKSLQQVKNNVYKAIYGKMETVGAYIPQAKASMDYNNYLGYSGEMKMPGVNPSTGERIEQSITIDFPHTSNFQFQASQVIFNGNAIVGIMLGKIGEKMAELNEENQSSILKMSVAQSYYAVLLSEETRKILVQNIAFMRDLAQKTKSLADGGVLEQTDADQIQVQVNLVENMLKDADRNNSLAYSALKVQMGLRSEDEIILTDNLDDLINSKNNLEIASTSYNIDADPAFMLVKGNEELAKKQRLMSIMNYLPTVAGFYQRTEKILKPNFDMSPKDVVGLTLTVPLFSGLQNTYKYKQANIDYQNARLNSDLLRDQMQIKEQQLRFSFRTALEQYETQKQNSDVASRVLQNMQLKYTNGVKSSMEMTTANSDYLRAQTDYLSAVAKVLQARVELEQLLGTL